MFLQRTVTLDEVQLLNPRLQMKMAPQGDHSSFGSGGRIWHFAGNVEISGLSVFKQMEQT